MKKLIPTKRVMCSICHRRFAVPKEKESPYICGRCKSKIKKEE